MCRGGKVELHALKLHALQVDLGLHVCARLLLLVLAPPQLGVDAAELAQLVLRRRQRALQPTRRHVTLGQFPARLGQLLLQRRQLRRGLLQRNCLRHQLLVLLLKASEALGPRRQRLQLPLVLLDGALGFVQLQLQRREQVNLVLQLPVLLADFLQLGLRLAQGPLGLELRSLRCLHVLGQLVELLGQVLGLLELRRLSLHFHFEGVALAADRGKALLRLLRLRQQHGSLVLQGLVFAREPADLDGLLHIDWLAVDSQFTS